MRYEWGSRRSNYFAIKNETAFRQWAEEKDIGVLQKLKEGTEYFAIYVREKPQQPRLFDYCDWPLSNEDAEDDFASATLYDELAPHLADGEVAVLIECAEFHNGFAQAINNRGETIHIGFEDIVHLARHLGNVQCLTEQDYTSQPGGLL